MSGTGVMSRLSCRHPRILNGMINAVDREKNILGHICTMCERTVFKVKFIYTMRHIYTYSSVSKSENILARKAQPNST